LASFLPIDKQPRNKHKKKIRRWKSPKTLIFLFCAWTGMDNALVIKAKTLAAHGLEERRNFEELLTESVGCVHFP
jgi:hypothetical protein